MSAALLTIALSLAQAGTGSDYQTSYDTAFRAAFRNSAVQSCVGEIRKNFPQVDGAPALCACAADKILATESVSDLRRGISGDVYRPIVLECLRAYSPTNRLQR
ncbi:MAG TPA: hypothetical protein VHY34_10845 [Caulobacteraceae bacterium]|jgi:hypothetical protein|nr:hypothetical protein [Caulobacteraceae bacterium]